MSAMEELRRIRLTGRCEYRFRQRNTMPYVETFMPAGTEDASAWCCTWADSHGVEDWPAWMDRQRIELDVWSCTAMEAQR